MEAAFKVRRRRRDEPTKLVNELCLICQKRTNEETRDASSAGLISVKDASSKRTKFHCDAYIDTIDMLNSNTHVLNDLKLDLAQIVLFVIHEYVTLETVRKKNSRKPNLRTGAASHTQTVQDLPPDFHEFLAYSNKKRLALIFPLLDSDWFEPSNECSEFTRAKNFAWFLCRNSNPDMH